MSAGRDERRVGGLVAALLAPVLIGLALPAVLRDLSGSEPPSSSDRSRGFRELSALWSAAVDVTVLLPDSRPKRGCEELAQAVEALIPVVWPKGTVMSRWAAFWPALAMHQDDHVDGELADQAARLREKCVAVAEAGMRTPQGLTRPWTRLFGAAFGLKDALWPVDQLTPPPGLGRDERAGWFGYRQFIAYAVEVRGADEAELLRLLAMRVTTGDLNRVHAPARRES